MDKETKARLADFFEPWDFVQLLGLTTEQIIEAFEDVVEDNLEDLDEIMEYRAEEA